MKLLVTGGSGFIGRYFYELLGRQGHDLTILDLVRPEWDATRARYVQGDVRDPASVRDALDGCEGVLHLAAAHHDFGIAHDTYFSVNEGAAKVLCDAMDERGVRRICFYSTVAVYGDAPEPHHETAETRPNSPYGASKLAGEGVLRRWTERGDARRCLVVRPTVTFGPRNFANMYSLIRQIHGGRFVQVGAGTNIKSLSYVENIVEATMFLWEKAGLPAFGVYNYIDKPDMTSRQIGAAVYESLGKSPPSLTIPFSLARIAGLPFDLVIALTGKNLPVSTARIRKLAITQTKFEADKALAAGYRPRVPLREGIDRMVKWYLARGKNEKPIWHTPPAEVGGALMATHKAANG